MSNARDCRCHLRQTLHVIRTTERHSSGTRCRPKKRIEPESHLTLSQIARYDERMATQQQIADFAAFATTLSQQQGGEALSIDEIYQRWWETRHAAEDLAAIQVAARDYENGERGRPSEEAIADFRRERSMGEQR